MPVSTNLLLRLESAACSDYPRQAACITLGVMLNFAAAHDVRGKMQNTKLIDILHEAPLTLSFSLDSREKPRTRGSDVTFCGVALNVRVEPVIVVLRLKSDSGKQGHRGSRLREPRGSAFRIRTRGSNQPVRTVLRISCSQMC